MDGQGRATTTGPLGYDSQDRTERIGQPQDRQNRTDSAGKIAEEGRTRQKERERTGNQYRAANTGLQDRL
jgi:hypothetical protein